MLHAGLLALLFPACALAQLAAPNDAGVSVGHIHFNARDPDAQRRFWTLLGATPGKRLGPNEVFKFGTRWCWCASRTHLAGPRDPLFITWDSGFRIWTARSES